VAGRRWDDLGGNGGGSELSCWWTKGMTRVWHVKQLLRDSTTHSSAPMYTLASAVAATCSGSRAHRAWVVAWAAHVGHGTRLRVHVGEGEVTRWH
jgi:hypothetical protein